MNYYISLLCFGFCFIPLTPPQVNKLVNTTATIYNYILLRNVREIIYIKSFIIAFVAVISTCPDSILFSFSLIVSVTQKVLTTLLITKQRNWKRQTSVFLSYWRNLPTVLFLRKREIPYQHFPQQFYFCSWLGLIIWNV